MLELAEWLQMGSIIALVAGIFYLNSAVRSNIRSINALHARLTEVEIQQAAQANMAFLEQDLKDADIIISRALNGR